MTAREEASHKDGYFACPKCRTYIKDMVTTCDCGLELNASQKIRTLVKKLKEQEAKTKSINKRLREMNLLFSKVVKWNYHKTLRFRKRSYECLNMKIHQWQQEIEQGRIGQVDSQEVAQADERGPDA